MWVQAFLNAVALNEQKANNSCLNKKLNAAVSSNGSNAPFPNTARNRNADTNRNILQEEIK